MEHYIHNWRTSLHNVEHISLAQSKKDKGEEKNDQICNCATLWPHLIKNNRGDPPLIWMFI